MKNSYILKNKNNELLFFYYGIEKSIYYKKYVKGSWTNSIRVIKGVTDSFTLDFYKTGEIFIFCQNLYGDIVLCKEEKNNFKSKVMFKKERERKSKALFYSLIDQNNMTLIYNTSTEGIREETLVRKCIGYEQKWSSAEQIDTFYPFNLAPFKVQKIKDDYLIALYQKRGRENFLGYREITTNRVSSFNIFHKTSSQIIDQSFLVTENSIHFLYVVKNIFSSQIIYRKRDNRGFLPPILIYEGNKVKSCNLSIIKGKLYAFWLNNSNLVFSVSDDDGETFNTGLKNKKWISSNLKKVDFISFNKMSRENFIFNEIYLDTNDFNNILFLKEECPEFFDNSNLIEQNRNYNVQKESKSLSQNILRDDFMSNFQESIETFFSKSDYKSKLENKSLSNYNNLNNIKEEFIRFGEIDGFKDFETPPNKDFIESQQGLNTSRSKIEILQNRLNSIEIQLSQKNKQILELNDIIKNKTKQSLEKENKLKKQIELLEKENKDIKSNMESLNKDRTKVVTLENALQSDDGGQEIEKLEDK